MPRNPTGTLWMLALLGVGLLAAVAAFAQVGKPLTPIQSTLKIRPLKGDSIKPGVAVPIGVTLTNTSNSEMLFGKERYGHQLRVYVRDSTGKAAAETKLGHVWNLATGIDVPQHEPPSTKPPYVVLVGSSVDCDLKRGDSTDWEIDAASLFNMNQPGKYTVQVEMRDPQNSALALTIKSNEITVTVTP